MRGLVNEGKAFKQLCQLSELRLVDLYGMPIVGVYIISMTLSRVFGKKAFNMSIIFLHRMM